MCVRNTVEAAINYDEITTVGFVTGSGGAPVAEDSTSYAHRRCSIGTQYYRL